MKRRGIGWLAILALALPGRPAHGEDLPELKTRGTLRVLAVVSPENPHFVALNAGTPTGFDVEILDGFARLQGLKLQVVPESTWDGLIPALLKARGDLIAGGFTDTESRRAQIAFSSEVFPTRSVVLTRRPHRPIHTLAELRAERVGVIKGTSMVQAVLAAGVPAAQLDDSLASGSVPEALRSGRVGVAVDGIEAALTARRADPELEIGVFLGQPESLAYGVRKTSPRLLAALNEYVANVRRTPTWSRLAIQYFGDAAPEILKKARSSE